MGTPSRKPEIRIVLRKRLVRELGIINPSEFFKSSLHLRKNNHQVHFHINQEFLSFSVCS